MPQVTQQPLLSKLFCLAGWHEWFEPTMDFFNPCNVKEECLFCGAKRVRFDKRRRKDTWRKRRKWYSF